MLPNVKAEKNDGTVVQATRFRVNTLVLGRDVVGVGDLVYVAHPEGRCREGSFGYIRGLGADGLGDLIVRIDLVKTDPMCWPMKDLWVYPRQLNKTFTERWTEES